MNSDALMSGVWICDKCSFVLQKNILHAYTGSVTANDEPFNESCPNDGVLMRPLTWREANQTLFDALILERNRLNWLDAHCSFVADFEYNLGPFKVGELRMLADAGLAVDALREKETK